MIEVGTKIRFNYGAMHCDEFGTVTDVSDFGIVTIKGDIGFVEEINESCIKMPGETTVNGSSIGVFVGPPRDYLKNFEISAFFT